MSAPGIQLSSQPALTYFHPTIQEYLQSIKEAVISNNLPAARQAFAQLTKAIPSSVQSGSGETNEFASRISEGMRALGQALETSDLATAQQAVGGLRTSLQSMSDAHSSQPQGAAEESASGNTSDVSPGDGGIAGGGINLNVRA
jgi:hypothetical protein